jgi:c-di-AMP phosphodiesterase-like protein
MQISTRSDTRAHLATAHAVRLAGMYLVAKARQQARDTSTFQAASNLRKQGAPLAVALAALRGGV